MKRQPYIIHVWCSACFWLALASPVHGQGTPASPTSTDPGNWTVFATVVTAIATVVYVILTILLWKTSSAAARATQRSADISEQLKAIAEKQTSVAQLQAMESMVARLVSGSTALFDIQRSSSTVQEQIRKGLQPNNMPTIVGSFRESVIAYNRQHSPTLQIAVAGDPAGEKAVVKMLGFMEEMLRGSLDKWMLLDDLYGKYLDPDKVEKVKGNELWTLLDDARVVVDTKLQTYAEELAMLQRKLGIGVIKDSRN